MSNQGWIKLHRKLLESPIFKDSQAVHLWLHILLKANHKDGQFLIGNTMVDIKRGQMLTGRKALAKETGINESKIRRLLNLYEIDSKVTIKKTTKYSIISITNYDLYQESDQQTANKRPTSDQQVTTNKNDKNEDNVKKKPIAKKKKPFSPPSLEEIEKYIESRRSSVNAKTFFDYFTAGEWIDSNGNKVKSWKQKIITWEGNGNGQRQSDQQSTPISKPLSNGRI
jgi:hypothetical protein